MGGMANAPVPPNPGDLPAVATGSADKCKNCNKEMSFVVAQPEVINTMSMSMIVWAHEKLQHCPHCGQGYQFMVRGVGAMKFGFQMINAPEEGRLIVAPPPGMKLPKMRQ